MNLWRQDEHKAVTWAREHWHVALFASACVVVFASILVYRQLLSEGAGVAAALASAIYVLLTTWSSTRPKP